LGASLHNVLTRLKAQPQTYPQLDLAYSAAEPIVQPVILTLPANGIRLRFDGPDQRLRLVEVLDFSKTSLTYKNNEVVRQTRSSNEGSSEQEMHFAGPPFRHVYNRLFGPTYPGEYVRPEPNDNSEYGTYVLSYPGVAFSFPLKHTAWSERSDFVSLLSSSAASAATSMCVFNGSSWPEARSSLFTRVPPFPRSIALLGRNKECVPDEIEDVNIYGAGQIVLIRRTAPRFSIKLGETTPQDLVAELGPPDAIYRKSDTRITIHGSSVMDDLSTELPSAQSMRRAHSKDSNASSSRSFTGESDVDSPAVEAEDRPVVNPDCFYNYFHHGFDALISFPTRKSPPFPGAETGDSEDPLQSHLVVTKILLHANVPGSYPFNRHRFLLSQLTRKGRS
jgi:isoleucyl-tRNA synthetase